MADDTWQEWSIPATAGEAGKLATNKIKKPSDTSVPPFSK